MARLAFVEKSQGEYWDRLNAGIYAVAKPNNDDVCIYAPLTVDPVAQLECLKTAINDRPDALVIVSSDPKMFEAEIRYLLNSGIPVLTMDLDGYTDYRLFHFGTLPYTELGRLAAEEMLKRLRGDGPIIVQAGSNAPGACGKLAGFCERMKEANRKMVVIDPDFENPDLAFSRIMEAIQNTPDVAGLYGVYAYHCIIQSRASELSGLRSEFVPIIGFDMLDETVKRLKDGSITASIWIREYDIGATAALAAKLFATHPWDIAIELLGGSFMDRQENIRRLPVSCFSRENVSDYVQWLKEHR